MDAYFVIFLQTKASVNKENNLINILVKGIIIVIALEKTRPNPALTENLVFQNA